MIHINFISVVEFQRWWVLKSKFFGQKSTYSEQIIVFCQYNEFQFNKKGQNQNFLCLHRIIWIFLFFSIKKKNLWAYFLLKSSFGNLNLCHALFYQIMHNFDVLIIHCTCKNTIFFFQYVDFWPKVLLDPPNLKFYNRHDINIHEYVTQKTFKP